MKQLMHSRYELAPCEIKLLLSFSTDFYCLSDFELICDSEQTKDIAGVFVSQDSIKHTFMIVTRNSEQMEATEYLKCKRAQRFYSLSFSYNQPFTVSKNL